MAPQAEKDEGVLKEAEYSEKLVATHTEPRKYQIVYESVLVFGYANLAAIYGLYLCFTSAKWATIILGFVLMVGSIIGITAGAHRLWTHKAYKAKLPLQIILMVLNSMAFQGTATNWVRDHRLHHKHSDTDADPHNASRGFFFAHLGWLLVKKHPEVKRCGKFIDMSDIYNNPVLRFQKKFAIPFIGFTCFGFSTLVPIYFWGETLNNAWNITIFRWMMVIHICSLVNSAAHLFGSKPYDKNILPCENILVALASLGEAFHNYHHVYPWDYRAAELGNNKFNVTTLFIDFFAWIGWAYDLKTVPNNVVKARCKRTGDRIYLWGWESNELSHEDSDSEYLLTSGVHKM